jgi:hypothetical protein
MPKLESNELVYFPGGTGGDYPIQKTISQGAGPVVLSCREYDPPPAEPLTGSFTLTPYKDDPTTPEEDWDIQCGPTVEGSVFGLEAYLWSNGALLDSNPRTEENAAYIIHKTQNHSDIHYARQNNPPYYTIRFLGGCEENTYYEPGEDVTGGGHMQAETWVAEWEELDEELAEEWAGKFGVNGEIRVRTIPADVKEKLAAWTAYADEGNLFWDDIYIKAYAKSWVFPLPDKISVSVSYSILSVSVGWEPPHAIGVCAGRACLEIDGTTFYELDLNAKAESKYIPDDPDVVDHESVTVTLSGYRLGVPGAGGVSFRGYAAGSANRNDYDVTGDMEMTTGDFRVKVERFDLIKD